MKIPIFIWKKKLKPFLKHPASSKNFSSSKDIIYTIEQIAKISFYMFF